jgi:hypothetical protein
VSKSKQIKKPAIVQGQTIKAPSSTIEIEHLDYPVFCFKHTHKKYSINRCNDNEKLALLDKLEQLSQLTWQGLVQAHRHGTGTEKIPRNSLKVNPPPFITEDVDHLLALRFDGMKPILVHRNRFIMHVIFIDTDYSVYKH